MYTIYIIMDSWGAEDGVTMELIIVIWKTHMNNFDFP